MPELRVPVWTKSKLANGAEFIVSEKHDLPLVSFSITFLGGGDQFESAEKRGVAGLTAAMMSEGTKTKTGDDLSNALQLLGTNVSVGVGSESGSISFVSTTARCRNPRHPGRHAGEFHVPTGSARTAARAAARGARTSQGPARFDCVARVSARALRRCASVRTVADRADDESHHAGRCRRLSPTVLQARARADYCRRRRDTCGRPCRRRARARELERGGRTRRRSRTRRPATRPTTIYLVDKPGSAQSIFAIGLAGPPRSTPDYYALQVMNTILGGMFQARLNANIREEKGYSYGVSSGFGFGKVRAPSAQVVTSSATRPTPRRSSS